MPDDELLRRLVVLDDERAAEEWRGVVRWLRPDFQDPKGIATAAAVQAELDLPAAAATGGPGTGVYQCSSHVGVDPRLHVCDGREIA